MVHGQGVRAPQPAETPGVVEGAVLMAGRRPRETAAEQQGASPLKPPGARRCGLRPGQQAGNNIPGSAGGHKLGEGNTASRGNQANMMHGIYSRRYVEARALSIATTLLEDNVSPEHVRHPMFTLHLMSLSRAEAMSSLLYEYVLDVLDTDGPAAVFGMEAGVPRALAEVWKSLETRADRLRETMGLTPTGYAKISRDLGVAASASEDRLERAAREGHQIAARRLGITAAVVDAEAAEDGP
jgi:hypothetical protein